MNLDVTYSVDLFSLELISLETTNKIDVFIGLYLGKRKIIDLFRAI